jgi:hypothetical protein
MDERTTDPKPAPPAVEREAEPAPRFRYVLWSHASHDLPAGARRRPRAVLRDEAAGESDGTSAADDVSGIREQR